MLSKILPIKVWGKGGPNPPKVSIILEELALPYEIIPIPISDVKTPEYVAVNPNGRLPSIQDPNTGITLWESGAIIEYLIERYDTKQQLSFAPGTPESYYAKQWLFYQTTGQAPYYGQAAWFKKFHAEKLPSAVERYVQEVNRVSGVLDSYLAQQKEQHGGEGSWLVGNKLSYADLSFITWQKVVVMILGKDEYNEDDFPHIREWLRNMTSRKAVKSVLDSAGFVY